MLEEPSLSRQWVARRLQRALTVERWGGPARAGLSRTRAAIGAELAAHAANSRDRARALRELIRALGAEPYPSYGLGAPVTRFTTGIVGRVSARARRRVACFVATRTRAEYHALAAFVEGAPGVPADLVNRIEPMQSQLQDEFDALGCG